jgi:hypothetical protein
MEVHCVEEGVLVFGVEGAYCSHGVINGLAADQFLQ